MEKGKAMELSTLGLKDRAQWEAKGYQLPQFDRAAEQRQPEKIRAGFTLVQEIFSFLHCSTFFDMFIISESP